MARRYFKGPTFASLPRHARADKVFELNKRIANGPFSNFSSSDYIDEGVSWADIYFTGPDKFTLWNATVMSGPNAFQEAKQSAAFDEVYGMLAPEEKKADQAYFVPSDRPGMSEMKFPNVAFDKFDGRTSYEQIRKREEEIIPVVYAQHHIDLGYRYGIGLHSTVDLPILTVEILESFVENFLALVSTREYAHQTDAVRVRSGILWKSEEPLRNSSGPVYMSNALVI